MPAVSFVEASTDDDENAEAAERCKSHLEAPGNVVLKRYGDGDGEQHQVGGQIADGVGDEMVPGGCALLWVGCRDGKIGLIRTVSYGALAKALGD